MNLLPSNTTAHRIVQRREIVTVSTAVTTPPTARSIRRATRRCPAPPILIPTLLE
jgi:hypothetical protein